MNQKVTSMKQKNETESNINETESKINDILRVEYTDYELLFQRRLL